MTRSERRHLYLTDAATRHGVTIEAILSPSRNATVVRARRHAMRRYRDEAGYSLPEIGRVFGRHHTTVLLALRADDAGT